MKKILPVLFILINFSIFSQTLTFTETSFEDGDESQTIIKKEYGLYKRAYNPAVDEEFRIEKIILSSPQRTAEITFNNEQYLAKYSRYPDVGSETYLFKFGGSRKFSLTLISEGNKIRFLYKIPNRNSLIKTALRDLPESDIKLLKENGFTDSDIDMVSKGDKYTIFYTGFVEIN